MIPASQEEVFKLLGHPATYGPKAERVERIDTHISAIFLVGDRAYKLKRAVDLGFVDFSTLEKRQVACEKELALNLKTAPSLYRGLIPVTREMEGFLSLGGSGEVVDWVVEMNRFDQNTLFDRMAARGALHRDLMSDLGVAVAKFHASAEPTPGWGGSDAMRQIIFGNRESFCRYVPDTFRQEAVDALTEASLAKLDKVAELLDERRRNGFVKRCHGDLHLRNICLVDDRPTLFDAIEFNDSFANIDTFYDLAFLLMDLEAKDMRLYSSVVHNYYQAYLQDMEGLRLLPLFLSMRAAIRSHVAAAMAGAQPDPREAQRLRDEAQHYLRHAKGYLKPAKPRLVAVGGFSGSGKSRMGRELSPYIGQAPGALVLRTDAIRKRIMGVELYDHLEPDCYTPEMSDRTYHLMDELIDRALRAGHSVISDAVFAKRHERDAVEAIATRVGVPFTGLWLTAPSEIMAQRIRTRQHNVSDATEKVLDMQMHFDIGDLGNWRTVSTDCPKEVSVHKGLVAIGLEDD